MTIVAAPHLARSPYSPTSIPCPSDLVDATAFRAWVRQLISDTGLPWRAIARAAGVPSSVVAQLLHGVNGHHVRMIPRRHAQRLLGLTHRRLAEMATQPAPCSALRMLMWRLGLDGASVEEMARFTTVPPHELRTLMSGSDVWCTRLQMLRAEAACEARGIDPETLIYPSRRQWMR